MSGKPFNLSQIKKIAERTAQKSSTLAEMNKFAQEMTNREITDPEKLAEINEQENDGPSIE